MKWKLNEHAEVELFPLHNSKEYNVGMKRPLVLICPGGGFIFKSDREAQPIAVKFNSLGMHAAVLFYTAEDHCPDIPNTAAAEVGQALKQLEQAADEYLFDLNNVYLCGFSAGGYIAANYIRHQASYEPLSMTIRGLILGYAATALNPQTPEMKQFGPASLIHQSHNMRFFGHEEVSEAMTEEADLSKHICENHPPVFIWTTYEDQLVDCRNSIRYALACTAHQIPVEFHMYQQGEHGLALCDCTTARKPSHFNSHVKSWLTLLENWLNQQKGETL